MSQPSGAYTSSSFDTTDGLPLDALQYLLPDDSLSQRDSQSQLLSESQLDSVSDLPDYRSCVAYQAPSTLPRIKPDRINEFIVCAPEMTAEFVKWWLDTGYGKSKRINWDGNLTNRRAECWKGNISMGQGAESSYRRRVLVVSDNLLLSDAAEKRPAPTFTQQVWEQMLLDLITTSNLPFLFVEHQKFRDLFSFARLAPEPPSFPSRKVIRERLRGFVLQYQQETLQTFHLDAFMATTGYFLDKEWEYREVLLGFEPLSGTHSGVNLGKIVLQILQKHQITDRVLAVTTDNASNNKTLITAINDSIHELQLKTDSTIIQVPCLAHVIQLSLVELLGKIKASPKNDNTELEWSEDRSISLRARQQKRDITDTLNKVRGFAVFINGSPQRKEAFLKLESNGQKLIPIQDVRTRWNSTFLMLRRAQRLSTTFDEYCSLYHQPHFALNAEGWRQIDYLLHILQPFFTYTTLVCQTNDSSIHLIFSIYNKLFDHLERSMHQLRRKRVAWKQPMLSSLEAAKDKLSKYYNPSNKMEFFSTCDWAPDDTGKDYTKEYRQSLQSLFEKYRLRTPSNISPSDGISFPAKSALERILKDNSSQRSTSPYQDELTKYLQSATVNESAQVFWRSNEREFPILASITRDVMSIPATGAGVERLFNSARDICHYRRGSLSPETIRDIMLYMCITRFDTKEEQRQVLQEYLSEQEIAASSEELHIGTHCAEAISDTEEDMEMHLHTPAIAPLSAVAAGKRPAINSDDEEDSDADDITDLEETSALPLPDTQQRTYSILL
ncbi:HAT dimerization [Penicillium italicum]|uniref:HAT dimerization n=1 Tax=Penicillium italicum TaxID=40296 RepID=A0A0A2KN65_PENIT|nr:HAT dimerization [Penicillium italicum]